MIRYFLLLFLPFGLFAQFADSVLTVQDAVSLALEKNYDIRLVKNQTEISINNNTLGNAGILPVIEASGSVTKSNENTEREFFDGRTQLVDGAKSTVYNAGATLNWTLFDGLKMFATKERLNELQRTNQYLLNSQIQNTVSDVMKAFYNTALEQERLALLQNTLELSEERVQISKNKYEVGKASKLEYLQAQVDFNTDRSALVKQQEIIQIRKYQLIQFLGEDMDTLGFTLDYDYTVDRLMVLDRLLESASANNPNLRSIELNREVSILSKVELERDRLPTLDFNLGYSYSNLNAEAGFTKTSNVSGINYGLTARLTIFDGWNQNRQIQNARITAENTQLTFEQAKIQLATSIRAGFLTYQNSLQLSELEQQNLEVAKENENIALERYRIGKSNPLELREAQNNAVNAQIRYLEALLNSKIAEIELQRLSGQLIQ